MNFEELYRKIEILYNFINKNHDKTTRKSYGGGGVWICSLSPEDHKIYHERFQSKRKNIFYIYLVLESTCGPQENLVVGVGICPFLPEDHKIHHKIFNLGEKILFIYIFVLESTTRPQENLVVGGGVLNIFIFTRRPQDLPRELSI